MAKPTKVPTWATDADYSSGPEVGTPTKADPGAGVQAEGYIPQTRLAAQVINWWQNLVGQWTSWLDSTFAGGDGEVLEIPAGLSVPGQFMLKGITVIDTPGPGTYNVPAGVRALRIFAIGGGGAGGGAVTTSGSNVSVGSGGGAGAVGVRWITSPDSSYAYTVGDGGAGSPGSNGGSGQATTIAGMSAGGGTGGLVLAEGTDPGIVLGGATGNVTGDYDYRLHAEQGRMAIRLSSAPDARVVGIGGAGAFGQRQALQENTGYGTGGNGALATGVQSNAGQNGTQGAIIIEEYA